MDAEVLSGKETVLPEFLSGGGELGQRIRNFDWASTSLGPVENWPQSLRTCIRIMLTSRQPIWIGWGQELIKFYNDPYKAIVGGKHPWALGTPASVVWKDIWKDIQPMLDQVMNHDQGTYVESQLLIMERNGYPEETYYTFSYTPIPGDDGKTAGMFCANTDDTDRIISQRQLKTLTQLGNRLSESKSNDDVIGQTIFTLSENGFDFPFAAFYSIQDDKACFAASTDLGTSEGLLPSEISLNEKSELSKLLQEAIVTRKFQLIEHLDVKFGKLPSGAWQVPPSNAMILPIIQASSKEPYGFIISGCNPYRLIDEKYAGFFSLIADQVATSFSQVHAFEQERKRVEALAEIDKAKTIFFSNVSHEFRTPITLMLGSIEEAMHDSSSTAFNNERMETAHRNAMRLLRLVNNLLDFSRIEAGKVKARYQLTDVARFTAELASSFRSIIENAGLRFIVNCEHIVQPVYIDKGMWEKIVLNLLSNAFKYTLNGQITISITGVKNNICLKVSDTGVGIPADELPKMFQRFHRVQNVTGRTYEGTGIGLSLTSELVKLHGGDISVASSVGFGSEFTITIPAGKDHLPEEQVADTEMDFEARLSEAFIEEATSIIGTDQKRSEQGVELQDVPRVLVVDDNPDMRQYLKRILSKEFKVTTANNGRDALLKLAIEAPDLVLTDVMMPLMDGVELLKYIKSDASWKAIPVIFLSARAGEEAKIEGYDIGADDYLVKPFSAKELIARVRSQIQMRRVRESEQKKLRDLFRQAPVAIAIFKGKDLIFDFVNDAYLPLIQKKREDVEGKPLFEVLPTTKQTLEPIAAHLYETGEPFHTKEFELTLLRNGKNEVCYFDGVWEPIWEEGKVAGFMAVVHEVTTQVMARKKVEVSEKQFRRVLLDCPSIFLILKGLPELTISFANKPLLDSWGKTADIIGKPLMEVLPELQDQPFPQLLYKVYTTGEACYGFEEKAVVLKNGKPAEVYYNYVYQPIIEDDNAVSGITVMATDVTEQVMARKKIEKSEQFNRLILENTPDCFKILDKDGRLQYMNAHGVAMMEIDDFQKFKYKYWWELWDKETRLTIKEAVKKANAGQIVQFQAFCKTAKGTGKWWDVVVGAVHAQDDGRQLIAVSRDISNGKKIESILDGQKRALELAVHGKSLHEVLATILETAESQSTNDLKGSILLIDDTGKHLLHGAAPSLPESYNSKIHGIEIGPDVGSCGTAAFTGKEIIVTDIEHDPLWKNFKDLALSYGLRACWSTPIFSSHGKLLGTFALYYKEVHSPTTEEKEVVELLSRTAGIIMEWYQDVQQRQLAERALLESEEQFRTLADSIQNMAWMADKTGKRFWYNQRWFDYTGTTLEEMQGWGWKKIHHPDHVNRVLNFMETAWAKGDPFELTYPLRRYDGEYRWFLTRVFPIKNREKEVVRWVGTNTDIDEQKSIEEKLERLVAARTTELEAKNIQLKTSESFLQQLIDSSIEFICVIDKDLRLLTVNRRVEQVMKVSRQELKGKNIFQINPLIKDSDQLKYIRKALDGETVYDEKQPTLANPDMYVDSYYIPLRIGDSVEGAIIMAKDVTEIVRTERLLQQKNLELQRSNEDLQQFAHVASHDLREPVRKVRTFTKRLQDECFEDLPVQGRSFLEKIQQATDRMLIMIDGVLTYSKLSSTGQNTEQIDLNEVFQNIVTDLELLINQKKAVVKWTGLEKIYGAPVLIYQLFYNLVNNSLKFSRTDTATEIFISGSFLKENGDEHFKVVVSDNGIGFAPENAEKIFNTFTRLHSKDKYEGTGLGLALCKKIVERHNGRIWANSEKDKGAEFTVVLPVNQEQISL